MDRFDKFTDRARKVLIFAQDQAMRRGHNYIGTEHLLLGLVGVDDSVGVQALQGMGVEPARVRTAVNFVLGGSSRPVSGEVGLTPAGRRVIELSIDEARLMGHTYIGSEHLLLGLIREKDGIAAGVLETLGVDLDRSRREVERLLALQVQPEIAAVPEVVSQQAEVEASRLTSVVAIGIGGSEGDSAEPFLELIALEMRSSGCLLHWKARWLEDAIPGQASLRVNDHLGTRYETSFGPVASSGRDARGMVVVKPAPPAGCTSVHLELRLTSLRQDGVANESFIACEAHLSK